MSVAGAPHVLSPPPTRIRALCLYRRDGGGRPSDPLGDFRLDTHVHACARFRSLEDPERGALYAVGETGPRVRPGQRAWTCRRRGHVEHALIAVREFHRVPLRASSLALTLFAARPGRAVSVVATLACFIERAVDSYRPGYLLLAYSMREPWVSMLLTSLRGTQGFSLEELRAEVGPLLQTPPERYAPDFSSVLTSAPSPHLD